MLHVESGDSRGAVQQDQDDEEKLNRKKYNKNLQLNVGWIDFHYHQVLLWDDFDFALLVGIFGQLIFWPRASPTTLSGDSRFFNPPKTNKRKWKKWKKKIFYDMQIVIGATNSINNGYDLEKFFMLVHINVYLTRFHTCC